jgi:two-component system OmpR family response regulator/two-component system response regulator RstA
MPAIPVPMDSPASVLLVEDDEALAQLVSQYLAGHDMHVEVAHRGEDAVRRVRAQPPQVVVLDVGLPDRDGFSVCREIRGWYAGAIVMLTARDEDVDQIVGLELGADDYLVKPVQPRLLLARLRAMLRRAAVAHEARAPLADDARIDFGRFSIQSDTRAALVEGTPLELTSAEFDLLWLLARNAGTILSRDDLVGQLRGIRYDGLDRSIDSRVSRLRRKLGEGPGAPVRIRTVRGKGYLFSRCDW